MWLKKDIEFLLAYLLSKSKDKREALGCRSKESHIVVYCKIDLFRDFKCTHEIVGPLNLL